MKNEDQINTNDHSVEIVRIGERVQVTIGGEMIADTTSAIKVLETGYEPIIYIPKNDLKEIDLIKCGDYHCPFKGLAELYTIKHGAHDIENGAWSYSEPVNSLPELQGRVAFYPSKVQEIRVI